MAIDNRKLDPVGRIEGHLGIEYDDTDIADRTRPWMTTNGEGISAMIPPVEAE